MRKKQTFPLFGDGFAVVPPRWGNLKEGVRTLQIEFSEEMFEISLQNAFRVEEL